MDDSVLSVNPHLQRVLKTYQNAAIRSLSGPTSLPIDLSRLSPAALEEYKKAMDILKNSPTEKLHYEPYVLPGHFPVFTPVDTTTSEQSETLLEGETIACFVVGGEKRLCLPQILNTVLRDFTLQEINAVCDDLHIFCTRCNAAQLATLKLSGILPPRAASCGLITKTDAERLCSALVHCTPEKSSNPPSVHCIRVYHNCFGKGDGHFNPELYTCPDAKCIHCAECQGLFAATKFVCHSHKAPENRTCHWGFDSERWRDYLLVKDKKFQDALENLKAKFDPKHKHKRRQSPDHEGCEQKRAKTEAALAQDVIAWGEATSSGRDSSAFMPWTPAPSAAAHKGKLLALQPHLSRDSMPNFLHNGPPVLLNPERVIPYSESQRYERHFTPNVSLAPSAPKTGKTDEDNERGEEQEEPEELTVKVKEEPSQTQPQLTAQLKAIPMVVSVPSAAAAMPVAMDSSRDYREYDLPTESDDSSIGQSSPLDSGEEPRFSDSPVFESSLEQELALIHQALDGRVANTKEARDAFLHQYSKLRARQEEMVHSLCREKHGLKKDLSLMQSLKEDLKRKLRALENELAGLRLDSERRERTVQEEREALAKKMASIVESSQEMYDKSPRHSEMKARLQHFESLYHDLQIENTVLRTELKHKGIDIVELLAEKKQPLVDGSANSSNRDAGHGGSFRDLKTDKLKVAVEGGRVTKGNSAAPLLLPSRPPKILPPQKGRDLIVE